MTTTIHERKREAARGEIAAVALSLFLERGFDATTADDLAAAAGVSRRTFFRYFATKEDVVVGYFEQVGVELGELLAQRPPHEAPVEALRRAFSLLASRYETQRAQVLAISRLADGTPSLRARRADKHDRWLQVIAAALAAQSGGRVDDLRLRLTAGVGMTAFDAAFSDWVASDGQADFGALLDRAFDALVDVVRA